MGKPNAEQEIDTVKVDFENCIGFSLTRKSADVNLRQFALNSDRITNSIIPRRK